MSTLAWIVTSGLAMTAMALVGSVALLLRPEQLQRVLLPLVAFAAGSLLGGALLHLLTGTPGSLPQRRRSRRSSATSVSSSTAGGSGSGRTCTT